MAEVDVEVRGQHMVPRLPCGGAHGLVEDGRRRPAVREVLGALLRLVEAEVGVDATVGGVPVQAESFGIVGSAYEARPMVGEPLGSRSRIAYPVERPPLEP
jgi:hypothetical protein